jgi:CDP-6-deoxy-D-xylo-4-hexulose-3-dehydrase
MQYLDEIVEKREANFQRFVREVNQNPDFYPIRYEHIDLLSNFALPIVCRNAESLEKYKARFEKEDVEIRPIIS